MGQTGAYLRGFHVFLYVWQRNQWRDWHTFSVLWVVFLVYTVSVFPVIYMYLLNLGWAYTVGNPVASSTLKFCVMGQTTCRCRGASITFYGAIWNW
jgi:hypothetical protein